MDKNELIALLNYVSTPIYQIEINLGIPKTALQKAIKGERRLPKKWCLKLKETYSPKFSVKDLTTPTNVKEPQKQPKTNFTINNTPKQEKEMPSGLDTAGRLKWFKEKKIK